MARRSGSADGRAARVTARRGIEIDGVARCDRPAAGRTLLPFPDELRFRRPIAQTFAAGAVAGYVAQAIGQNGAGSAPAPSAIASAAYERAEAATGIRIIAPMPAARLVA
jgi:hypothetical protein